MSIYVRFAYLGTIFALLICALVLEISVLAEIYRENKQRRRKNYNRPSKSDDPSSLDFCFDVKSGKERGKSSYSPYCWRYSLPIRYAQRLLVNIRKQSRYFFSQILLSKS